MYPILEKINGPEDVKALSLDQLTKLANEVRQGIMRKVSSCGGHFGPNLGVVELTIAMHYVFCSPFDKMVYDVSHQSYVHKMLTGRKQAFIDPMQYDTVTGFTEPKESEHDFFTVGHTSTSISLACGLAKAREINGSKENIIAIIGDGSLSGGQAYEGLNNAAASNKNMIIVVNDNQMSIAENYGGLYGNLKELRDTKGMANNNFFKALGFEYEYVDDGHDLSLLIEAFRKVKDRSHPVVIHIKTTKGKGDEQAEQQKEAYHYTMPFDLQTREPLNHGNQETYAKITEEYLIKKAKSDQRVVAINAAIPGAVGLKRFREECKEQYMDVGIAEEHAIALASAMASQGAKPVVEFASTFAQRTYDQISHDLAINKNPAVIVIHGNGISGSDVTHLGSFDIPLIANIPNMVYLAPTSKEEYLAMLDWAIDQNDDSVAIRVPAKGVVSLKKQVSKDYSNLNRYEITEQGSKVAILGLGSFYELGRKVHKTLKEKHGIDATLINPRFITGVDTKVLDGLVADHCLVITLEDGILDGGFGEMIARYYGAKEIKVLTFGATKEFTDKVPIEELYERYHLTEEWIIKDIIKLLPIS